ncbi:VOC family protein [Bacillaceae bacterium W0354]
MSFHELPTKYIDQLSLKVSDLNRSIQFYEQLLGFTVLRQNESEVTLSIDGQTSTLTLTTSDNVLPIDHRRTGLFHIAYLLPNRKHLADFLYYASKKPNSNTWSIRSWCF